MNLLKQLNRKNKMSHITENDFTKIDNNAMGNPRYVIHFLNIPTIDSDIISNMYNQALDKTKSLGGKKYHNKKYGGGIVFSTYNLNDLIVKLNELK